MLRELVMAIMVQLRVTSVAFPRSAVAETGVSAMTKRTFLSVRWYGKRTVWTEFRSKEIQKCDIAENEDLFHLYLFWFS